MNNQGYLINVLILVRFGILCKSKNKNIISKFLIIYGFLKIFRIILKVKKIFFIFILIFINIIKLFLIF